MAMQQSMAGSLRGSLRSSLQSINLVWKKEKATLERTLQYFDESGATIVLVWNHKRILYEGTAEMSLGRHSGSLFISDQGLEPTHLFEVDKQEIGVVQEILLLINKDPVFSDPCSTPITPTVPSMPPLEDSTPTVPSMPPLEDSTPTVPSMPPLEDSTPTVPSMPPLEDSTPTVPSMPPLEDSTPTVPSIPPLEDSTSTVPSMPTFEDSTPTVPSIPPLEDSTSTVPSIPPLKDSTPTVPSMPTFEDSTPNVPSMPPLGDSTPTVPSIPPLEDSTPTVPSMPPLGDSTPTDSGSLERVALDHKLIHSRPLIEPLHSAVNGGKELEAQPAALELTKENNRLLVENRSLEQQFELAKRDKQLIKQESFEIDEQLVAALESLSAYQQKQTLMDERYNAFTREARIMEEANQGMKLRINEMEINAARDHETLLQMQLDLGNNSEQIKKMYDERDTLITKCNCLEQSLAASDMRKVAQIEEIDRTLEKVRLERESNILKENCDKMRDRDIPSLHQDIEELKRQMYNSERRHQEELQLVTRERELGNSDGRKRIDQLDGADNERRDPMVLMEKLSHHFDDCTASLRLLVQLLEATVEAKDSQLDRRSGELRDARIRNDRLVEEVVSRGHQISTLTERLQSIMSNQAPLESTRHLIEEIDREIDPSMEPAAALPDPSRDQGAKPANVTLPSPADLIKYKPGIKSLYRGLTNITNKLIDFTDTPISVSMMNYLENPKTHIGNQVICMIHGNYLIGTLKTVFQFRPSVSGLGALSPITYAGIEFDAPVGTTNGSFRGVEYFECRENHAEYTSLENVYIHV